ncbi:MAG TPA: hypothetical protein VIV14_06120, partial [Gammaproteobacteria bacterium]
ESSLSGILAEYRPDIVYAPCWLDYHPEHRRVAQCLANVVTHSVRVRIYTLHIPLMRLANVRSDVSSEMQTIAGLFEAYATQRSSLSRGLRLRRYAAALSRCGQCAEEFAELSGTAYHEAHRADFEPPTVRGVRYRSFSDPLSYWIGAAARRRFARRSGLPTK